MSKKIMVGEITIPIENIDYVKEGDSPFIMLKSGRRIECTKEEAAFVAMRI